MTTHPRPAGPSISAAALDLFRKVSTATLTTQMFKRGFRNVYVRRVTRLTVDAWEQEQLEAFVLERIRNGAALPGTYPPSDSTRAAYEEWRRKQ